MEEFCPMLCDINDAVFLYIIVPRPSRIRHSRRDGRKIAIHDPEHAGRRRILFRAALQFQYSLYFQICRFIIVVMEQTFSNRYLKRKAPRDEKAQKFR